MDTTFGALLVSIGQCRCPPPETELNALLVSPDAMVGVLLVSIGQRRCTLPETPSVALVNIDVPGYALIGTWMVVSTITLMSTGETGGVEVSMDTLLFISKGCCALYWTLIGATNLPLGASVMELGAIWKSLVLDINEVKEKSALISNGDMGLPSGTWVCAWGVMRGQERIV